MRGDGCPGEAVSVAVFGVVAALILPREDIASRQVEVYLIEVRDQVREAVRTAAVSGDDVRRAGTAGLIDRVARCVEQMDGHALNAEFAAVLNAVAVDIVPDEVAEAGTLHHARVNGGVVVPCC